MGVALTGEGRQWLASRGSMVSQMMFPSLQSLDYDCIILWIYKSGRKSRREEKYHQMHSNRHIIAVVIIVGLLKAWESCES